MFVLKNNPAWDAFEVIAGEMLNREYSLDHFVNGVAREELPMGYVGYPAYVTPTRKYVLKAVGGTIYIPDSFDQEKFVGIISKILLDKVVSRLDGQPLSMKCSQRFGSNYATTHIAEMKNQRVITYNGNQTMKGAARFVWNVQHISKIDLQIQGTDPHAAIAKLSGIFWDVNDIVNLPHGTVSFTFSEDSFKATQRWSDEKLTLLHNKSNPLMFELSEYWRSSVPGSVASEFIREVNSRKVVQTTFDLVEVKPVRVDDASATMSTDICFRCKEPLYGDVYGLSGHVMKFDEPVSVNGKIIVTPICPLCLHTTPEESMIESKFARVVRIKWNKTPADMINYCEFSEVKRDMCVEAMKNITPCKVKIDDKTYKFYLIGDKYVGFEHTGDFKYTQLVNADILANRTPCKVMMVC